MRCLALVAPRPAWRHHARSFLTRRDSARRAAVPAACTDRHGAMTTRADSACRARASNRPSRDGGAPDVASSRASVPRMSKPRTIVFGRLSCNLHAARMEDDDWIRIAFGDLLRQLREERGLSQAQLALESDVDQTFVSLLERGRRQPTLGTLFALCDALRIDADAVVGALVTARKNRKRRT